MNTDTQNIMTLIAGRLPISIWSGFCHMVNAMLLVLVLLPLAIAWAALSCVGSAAMRLVRSILSAK